MSFEMPVEKWAGSVNTVTIGATGAGGGPRTSVVAADMISGRLAGAHPDQQDRTAEECAQTVKSVLEAVGVPVIIWGCGQAEKDNEVMPRCSEVAAGENCLLGTAAEGQYKTTTAAGRADG